MPFGTNRRRRARARLSLLPALIFALHAIACGDSTGGGKKSDPCSGPNAPASCNHDPAGQGGDSGPNPGDSDAPDPCNAPNPPAHCEQDPVCGDGVLDPGEDCDTVADDALCQTIGLNGGTAQCTSLCTVELSGCFPALRIQFDYLFDTAGYFDQAKRAIFEEAARIWSSRIAERFPPLPVNTELRVVNPEDPTGVRPTVITADWGRDILVFLGSQEASDNGQGATTWNYFLPVDSWSDDLYYNLYDRVTSTTKYQPFVASMTLYRERPYETFVDATPETDDDLPFDEYDLLDTAVHELGHVLGITAFSAAFTAHHSDETYVGPATSLNGGTPVPMWGGSHFDNDYDVADEKLCMVPTSYPGERELPSTFEMSVLEDVGYDVVLD